MVLRARGAEPEARAALAELCEIYWTPVFRFLRREGRNEDVSQDLTQEFFAKLLAGNGIAMIDPQKGRFRSYLLGALKHFLAEHRRNETRQKRGGGAEIESIEDEEVSLITPEIPDPSAMISDPYFDRQWGIALMERGLRTVEATFRNSGRAAQFEVLKPWLVGDTENLSQASAAAQLGMTSGSIKVAIHRLRKEFGNAIRNEIEQTVSDPDAIADELRYLIEVVSME